VKAKAMSAVATHKDVLAVRFAQKAVSLRSEVISPFQYYSEVGESIYVLHFASHRANAKLFLHYDARGTKIAQLLMQDDGSVQLDISAWISVDAGELGSLDSLPTDFAELLAEMHLCASQTPKPLYEPDELTELLALSERPPVVLGGCGRSGTTLLLAILGAHPAVLALGEEVYAFYPRPLRLRRLLDAIGSQGAQTVWQRWCEKTPKNVRAFDQIAQLFAHEVRLVHLVRDGRDVVTSHHPNDAGRYYISPERWVADVSAGLSHAGVHLVHYEDLVHEPRTTLKALCDFIGEEFDARMLSYEQHSTVRGNKAWDTGQASPLNSDRVERWLAPEHTERVREFMETPGALPLMKTLGYETI
jgi:hypothetical protein